MPDVIVVGAGVAGLCCARELHAAGLDVLVLERGDAPGGRVRTDAVDGFLLDRGFQVLLTAYPEARRVLDFERLGLRPFESGALIRKDGRFSRIADPFRHPVRAFESLRDAPGSVPDKLRVARLRRRLSRGSINEILTAPQVTTAEALRREGFSSDLVEAFFRPFLGGIFLDPSLETSSRLFAFVFKLFSEGEAVLPAAGMQAIPRQLAEGLPEAAVRYGATVESAGPGHVVLAGGERLEAASVVVAADGPEAARLTGAVEAPAPRAVTTLHYAAERVAGRRAGPGAERRGQPGRSTTSACRATWRRATRRRGRRWSRPPCSGSRRWTTRSSTRPSATSSAAGSARRWTTGVSCAPCASPSRCRPSRRRSSRRPSAPCACARASSSAATTATRLRCRARWSRAGVPRPPCAASTPPPPARSDAPRPARPALRPCRAPR